jgi:hypothetical protein
LSGVGSGDITARENTTDNRDHRIAKVHEAPRVEDTDRNPRNLIALRTACQLSSETSKYRWWQGALAQHSLRKKPAKTLAGSC